MTAQDDPSSSAPDSRSIFITHPPFYVSKAEVSGVSRIGCGILQESAAIAGFSEQAVCTVRGAIQYNRLHEVLNFIVYEFHRMHSLCAYTIPTPLDPAALPIVGHIGSGHLFVLGRP